MQGARKTAGLRGTEQHTAGDFSLSCLGIPLVSEARHGSGGVGPSSVSSPAAGISLPSQCWSRELSRVLAAQIWLFPFLFFFLQLLFDRLPLFSEEHKQGKEAALFFRCLQSNKAWMELQ